MDVNEAEKEFKKMVSYMIRVWLVMLLGWAAAVCLIGWFIFALLKHFGVIS